MFTSAIRQFTFVVFVFLIAVGPLLAQEDDPVLANLKKAKDSYKLEMKNVTAALNDSFDRREEVARKSGNKKAVDQVKAERKAFEENSQLPTPGPAGIKSKIASLRSALESAYRRAIKECVKSKRDDDAGAIESELHAFLADPALKSSRPHPADAVEFEGKFYKVFDTVVS